MSDKKPTSSRIRCKVCGAEFAKTTTDDPERHLHRVWAPLKKNYKAEDPARRERAALLREKNRERNRKG